MSELPTGTLTMLFSDIEGSTRLLAQLGPAYADLLSVQRRVVRAAVARWHGREMGTEGDSFFVVFGSVGEALGAARDVQLGLAEAAWPDGVSVRVRMGVHTGEPVRHEDGYVGMAVHLAARVAGCAHGGQVVLTEATYRIAAGCDLPGTRLTDLGLHRLKDMARPERLYQLVVDGLPAHFPPLRSLGSASTLPTPLTSLVGRGPELAELLELLGSPGVRLVTLTGPAGTGKTRLALAVAAAFEERHDDGVFFVPLAAARSADLLWSTVAGVLDLDVDSRGATAVLEALATRRLLLVLDNLEQLDGAAGAVRRLVAEAPDVRLLVTSRRPLRLTAEHEFPVGPLPVPSGSGAAAAPGTADRHGGTAVELFEQRARLVRPSYTVTDADAADVEEICRRLDGLPLAIELVAARAKLLGPRALRARLGSTLELSRSAVDVPERQQTLRAALDWSYELLPPHLQRLFRRLGACDGSFDLAAAAAVAGAAGEDVDGPDGTEERAGRGEDGGGSEVLDDIGELVDVNLLTVDEGADGEPRLRMLRTVAAYARQVLAEAGEHDAAARRHAQHYLALAEGTAEGLRRKDHTAARDRLEGELDNLRAALSWSLGRGTDEALELGLHLCGQLSWFWYGCGYQAEGRRWLQAAVDAAGARRSDAVMTALHGLGVLVLQQGETSRARDLLELCVEHWRGTDDLASLSRELNSLGMAYRSLDEPDLALRLVEEAVVAAEQAGDRGREANAVSNLAMLRKDHGRYDDAIALLHRCLDLDRELQDEWGEGADHVNLVSTLLRAGRADEAHAHLLAHAPAAVALRDVDITADVVGLFAMLHAGRGDAERAAHLYGTVEHLREQAELPLAPPDAVWFESVISQVRDRTDAATWERDVAAGRGRDVQEALDDAMSFSADAVRR